MIELHKRIGEKIQNLNKNIINKVLFGEVNQLFLMLQDLMYCETIPDEYKNIINKVFECDKDV